MTELNIVLVEPQIPQNTGNIARTCAATGARLHIVKPVGFSVDDKKLKRAGLDYWDYLDLTWYKNLDDFLEKTALTSQYFFTTKGEHVYSDVSFPEISYFLFGREDAGLPESLLYEHPENSLRLPMKGGLRSLNLSNTVAIATYEFLRQHDYPLLQNQGRLTEFSWPNPL